MSLLDQIAELNDEDFRDLVDRDLRRENTDAEAAALRSPALVDRWYSVLVGMLKSVDGQLAAKKEDFEAHKARIKAQFVEAEQALAEARIKRDNARIHAAEARNRTLRQEWASITEKYSRSRAATLRFKSGLEETMVEARAIRDKVQNRLYEHVVAQERNHYAERVQTLEKAIAEARDTGDSAKLFSLVGHWRLNGNESTWVEPHVRTR